MAILCRESAHALPLFVFHSGHFLTASTGIRERSSFSFRLSSGRATRNEDKPDPREVKRIGREKENRIGNGKL